MIAVFQILTSSSPIFKQLRQTKITANWSSILFLTRVVSRSDLRAVSAYYHHRKFRSFLSFSMQVRDNISNWATTASFHAHSSVNLPMIIISSNVVYFQSVALNDTLRRNCTLKHVVERKKERKKERKEGREDGEEVVSSYCVTLRKIKVLEIEKRKHQIALYGELILEEIMASKQDRLRNELNEVNKLRAGPSDHAV